MIDKKKLIKHAIYDKETGCLISLYSRSMHGHGYPQTQIPRGKGRHIHRVLLELKLKRKLAEDEFALHKCNNKRCISTAVGHVIDGSKSENALDSSLNGTQNRWHTAKTYRKPWRH